MKKYLFYLLILFFAMPQVFSEDTSVNLYSDSDSFSVGDNFNMDLVVENIPADQKCGGIEIKITYDHSLLSLSNIELDGNLNADYSDVKESDGTIKLAWFINPPSGIIDIAKVKFDTLNEGKSEITMSGTTISDSEGYEYQNISINGLNISVNPLNQTIAEITLEDYKTDEKINAVLSFKGVKTPINNISGYLSFENASIVENPSNSELLCSKFNYESNSNNFSFFIVPNDISENETMFELLKLPIIVNNENYGISSELYVNGVKLQNKSIIEEKESIDASTYSGLMFYVDNDYNTETELIIGSPKKVKLKVCNYDKNITNISGYLFINDSLFDVSEYRIPTVSDVYNKLDLSDISLNESHLYFNISMEDNGTNGTFSILEFKLRSKINENVSSTIQLGNLSVYFNETKLSFDAKDLDVNIVEKSENSPPSVKIFYNVYNNNQVHFYPISNDEDDDLDDLDYEWNFGDGTESTKDEPIHTYSNYSRYYVNCKVLDTLNASDTSKGIIELMDISPVSYQMPNTNLVGIKGENKTLYLNLTLNNPLNYNVNAYIQFVDYNDYDPLNSSYNVLLGADETKNLIIPINVTKSCKIKWNVLYYPPASITSDDIDIGYYLWSFDENVEFKEKATIINSTEYVDVNNTKVILEVNKVKTVENQVIYKTVSSTDESVVYYCFTAISGVFAGLIFVQYRIR
ncbi:PKD domain-containing protein [Methanococcus maripaludis]|uniref:PKD domain-containing protein n=1 Tax=Methanococcus maripaludis TaxID=39152 RepID=A0A7J9RZX4_METMI|nr:PKD domain-containing protein [Methanococcus maripaludis]MBB6067543.1 hypothetical protein [Methanococcus maripaludis]